MKRKPDELKRVPTAHWEPSVDEGASDTDVLVAGEDDEDEA